MKLTMFLKLAKASNSINPSIGLLHRTQKVKEVHCVVQIFLRKWPHRRHFLNTSQNSKLQEVYRVVQIDPRTPQGASLLHFAVNQLTPVDDFHTNEVVRFPCLATTKLLLKVECWMLFISLYYFEEFDTLLYSLN